MADALKKIFQDNLYPKVKDRNWDHASYKFGEEVVGIIEDVCPHPEQALCGLIHAVACYVTDVPKDKRPALLAGIMEAVKERVATFEEDEDETDAESNIPERPSPEPREEDDDDGPEDPDPNESYFNNPARRAGFQPPKRRPENR